MLQCYIIDDEQAAINILSDFVMDTPGLTLAGSNTSPVVAMDVFLTTKIDILFLDINMPKLSGIKLAELVKTQTNVVITTALPNYALEAYQADVYDYLLKPITYEKFLRSVSKIKKILFTQDNSQQDEFGHFYIKCDSKGKLVKINIDEIMFIEGAQNYIFIYTSDGKKHITYMRMRAVLTNLPQSFLQIHRSYIVNMQQISHVTGNSINLIDKTILNIGKEFKETFFENLNRKLITKQIPL